MYCTKCGVAIEQPDAFCSQCGTPTGRQAPMSSSVPGPRLTRSIHERKIAGICGGLSQYLALDPTLVRLIWLIATICFPPFLLGYIAAWIIVPMEAARFVYPVGADIPQPQQ